MEGVLLDDPALPKVDDEAMLDEPLGALETPDEGDVPPRTEVEALDAPALPVIEDVVTLNMVVEPLDASEVTEDEAALDAVLSTTEPLDAPAMPEAEEELGSIVVDTLLGEDMLLVSDVESPTAELLDDSALPETEKELPAIVVVDPLDAEMLLEGVNILVTTELLGTTALPEAEEEMLPIVVDEPLEAVEAPPCGAEESLSEAALLEVGKVTSVLIDEPPPTASLLEIDDELSAVVVADPLNTIEALDDDEAPPKPDDISVDAAAPLDVDGFCRVIVGELLEVE